ncbi:MAG: carbohydrate-binding module family 14 protein [Rikenellaceae bacterium]|nr:carbohydrate-binding module family 14 protein [Rikenellaceae bacterium]MCL2693401.1 carbohydrate-binding module family 14 protein [Rikenellaceae bacterium]
MKKIVKLLFPNRFFLWANGVMMGALIVMMVGMMYMKTINAAETRSGFTPHCPPGVEVFLPHPENCCLYFKCFNGVALLRACPLGLHFNAQLEACDWPEMAGCL